MGRLKVVIQRGNGVIDTKYVDSQVEAIELELRAKKGGATNVYIQKAE